MRSPPRHHLSRTRSPCEGQIYSGKHCASSGIGRDLNKKSRVGNLILKLDLEKAYGRLDWNFLKQVLLKCGFSIPWVQMVEKCWSNAWFSILINEEAAGFFKSARGIRQGNPLSPSLFILAVEVLSRGLNLLLLQRKCAPFSLRRGCKQISHLLYADDTLVFTNGSIRSFRALLAFLDSYQWASGQRINLAKSALFYSNKITPSRIRVIVRTLGISNCQSSLTYLGVPIAFGRVKPSAFTPLISKIEGHINGWCARCLSQAGRLVLMRHILGSIPVHSLAATLIPKRVLSALERRFADFLWDWSEGKKKLHWVRWQSVSLPKSEGGLGIRLLSDFMQALRLKLAWAFSCNEKASLWKDFMRSKYHSIPSALNHSMPSAVISPLSKQILQLLPLLDRQARWLIGQGYCSFWLNNWTSLGPLIHLASHQVPQILLDTKVNQVLGTAGLLPPSSVYEFLPQSIVDFFFQVGFFILDSQDTHIWPLTPSGVFFVSSAWSLCKLSHPRKEWSRWVWHAGLPPRISMLVWRLLHKAVPVDAEVQKQCVCLASCCSCDPAISPACWSVESLDHVFVSSPRASSVWAHFCTIFGLQPNTYTSVEGMLAAWWNPSHGFVRSSPLQKITPCIILWQIWKARSAARFDGNQIQASSIQTITTRCLASLARHFPNLLDSPPRCAAFADLGFRPSNSSVSSVSVIRWKKPT
ncbi:uncharacterized protein LOC131244104 [Magnolia sinica]|uniref:uncharacterized protein LOC131244104 n=1 Tax=Magnolia sinica TaxID=86752 RepID=UPI0026581726|nr:uncharacterized protein LOC131244104 [Magnolia sinica]